MININVSADNYEELKHKVFVALGITEPAQQKLPFQRNWMTDKTTPTILTTPTLLEDVAETVKEVSERAVSQAAKPAPLEGIVTQKRTRRTKAEIEAGKKQEAAAQAAPVKQEFDEVEESSEETNTDMSLEEKCIDALTKVNKTLSVNAALKLLAAFNVKKFREIPATRHEDFYNTAMEILANG